MIDDDNNINKQLNIEARVPECPPVRSRMAKSKQEAESASNEREQRCVEQSVGASHCVAQHCVASLRCVCYLADFQLCLLALLFPLIHSSFTHTSVPFCICIATKTYRMNISSSHAAPTATRLTQLVLSHPGDEPILYRYANDRSLTLIVLERMSPTLDDDSIDDEERQQPRYAKIDRCLLRYCHRQFLVSHIC